MACPGCAKKRASVTASNNVSSQQSGLLAASRSVRMAQDVNSLPGEVNGRVLAQYVGGKGKGKHYYQGRTTKFRYQVVFGQYIHADPRDVKEPGDNVGQSLLVRVPRKDDAKPQPQPKPVASVVAVEEKLPKRTPRLDVPKTPVLDDKTPDARRMSIPDIVKFNPTYEQAVEMLEQERKGQKRKGAIEYLKRIVDK